jgi:hypothetical protein
MTARSPTKPRGWCHTGGGSGGPHLAVHPTPDGQPCGRRADVAPRPVGGAVRHRVAAGNSSRPQPIRRVEPLLRWGVGPLGQAAWGTWRVRCCGRWCLRATVRSHLNWGDTMRRVIIRFLAAAAVLGGVVFTGAGVAAADQGRPVGGDNSSAPPCGAGDIDFAHGCFFGWGRTFS